MWCKYYFIFKYIIMCNLNSCVYCEIIELPNSGKLYIHYDTIMTPLWIEYYSYATNINEEFYPKENI